MSAYGLNRRSSSQPSRSSSLSFLDLRPFVVQDPAELLGAPRVVGHADGDGLSVECFELHGHVLSCAAIRFVPGQVLLVQASPRSESATTRTSRGERRPRRGAGSISASARSRSPRSEEAAEPGRSRDAGSSAPETRPARLSWTSRQPMRLLEKAPRSRALHPGFEDMGRGARQSGQGENGLDGPAGGAGDPRRRWRGRGRASDRGRTPPRRRRPARRGRGRKGPPGPGPDPNAPSGRSAPGRSIGRPLLRGSRMRPRPLPNRKPGPGQSGHLTFSPRPPIMEKP